MGNQSSVKLTEQEKEDAINVGKIAKIQRDLSWESSFSLLFKFKSNLSGLKKYLMNYAVIIFVSAKIQKTTEIFEMNDKSNKSEKSFTFITIVHTKGTLSNLSRFAFLIHDNAQVREAFLSVENFDIESDTREQKVTIEKLKSQKNEIEESKSQNSKSSGNDEEKVVPFPWEQTYPSANFLLQCRGWKIYTENKKFKELKPIEIVLCDLNKIIGFDNILDSITSSADKTSMDIQEIKLQMEKQNQQMAKMEEKIDQLTNLMKHFLVIFILKVYFYFFRN